MSYYTVKYVRDMLEGSPDDEPVYGMLSLRIDQGVEYRDEDGEIRARIPTPEEWAKIVDVAERDANPWAMMSECLNDAKNEVCPYPEDEEGE